MKKMILIALKASGFAALAFVLAFNLLTFSFDSGGDNSVGLAVNAALAQDEGGGTGGGTGGGGTTPCNTCYYWVDSKSCIGIKITTNGGSMACTGSKLICDRNGPTNPCTPGNCVCPS